LPYRHFSPKSDDKVNKICLKEFSKSRSKAAHFTETWCKGLRALKPLEDLTRRIVVYPSGPVMKTKDGIDILPFKYLADELAADTL